MRKKIIGMLLCLAVSVLTVCTIPSMGEEAKEPYTLENIRNEIVGIDQPVELDDGTRNLAEQFRDDLAVLGIQMDIVVEDWATLSESRNSGNFDIVRAGWICDSNDPLEMLENMTSDSYNNDCQFGAQ